MKWKILVSAPYMQPLPDRYARILREAGCEVVMPVVRERLCERELLGLIAEIDGVIAGDDDFTEAVYCAATRLKVVSKWGTGIDSLRPEIAARRHVVVRNTPNAFTDPVADTVLGYMLCFARNLAAMDGLMKRGEWTKAPGTSLGEKTLGVIGVGNIGRAVIRRARAFGMTVLGNDIAPVPEEFLRETRVTMVSKEELLSRSDFVSLNCDLNPTSRHILGKREFEMVQPGCVLINTARGPLVDEPELVSALEKGKLAGAGLDVFETEPLPIESPLRRLATALIAPHNSNSSPRAWERVHENTVRNLLEELEK